MNVWVWSGSGKIRAAGVDRLTKHQSVFSRGWLVEGQPGSQLYRYCRQPVPKQRAGQLDKQNFHSNKHKQRCVEHFINQFPKLPTQRREVPDMALTPLRFSVISWAPAMTVSMVFGAPADCRMRRTAIGSAGETRASNSTQYSSGRLGLPRATRNTGQRQRTALKPTCRRPPDTQPATGSALKPNDQCAARWQTAAWKACPASGHQKN